MMKNRKSGAIKTDLFAHEAHHQKLDEPGDPLQEIERHVDFATPAARVDESVPRPDRTKGGRPPYPTETMVRILVLKRLYNLSDEQMEYQLLDRMSYKRFCGLDDALRVPDRTTIWHFENRVGQAGAQALFGEMAEQLARKGFIARGGQIIDATLVKAPVQRNSRQENGRLRQGDVPEDWSDAKRRQKDVDASWTKKNGKSHFGYKLSVNVDGRYKLIRRVETDTARVHDSRHAKGLLDERNTARVVYADKAYSSQALRAELKDRGLRDGILKRAGKSKALTQRDEQRNRRLSRMRCRVEHVFAGIEQMGGKMVRTIGRTRAGLAMTMMALCYNIKRLVCLQRTETWAF